MLFSELDNAYNTNNFTQNKSFNITDNNKQFNVFKDDFNLSTFEMDKFMPNNQSYESDKQESEWASVNDDTELLPKKNNEPKTNLTGTTLNKLIKNKKLTHRECMKYYYDPNSKYFNTALKHVKNCNLCKNSILNKQAEVSSKNKKIIVENNDNLSSTSLNNFINNLKQNKYLKNNSKNILNNNSKKNKNITEEFDNESKKMSDLQSQIELQSPPAKPIIQQNNTQEDNLKYQNMLIQSTIQKYFESMEEKKELNDKLNKIYEMLSLEIKKNELFDKEKNYKYNSKKKNKNYESSYILIAIIFVIILLIIDIIVRIKF
jgi:hypothetical protein